MFNIGSSSINVYMAQKNMHIRLTLFKLPFVTHFKLTLYVVARWPGTLSVFMMFLLTAVIRSPSQVERT